MENKISTDNGNIKKFKLFKETLKLDSYINNSTIFTQAQSPLNSDRSLKSNKSQKKICYISKISHSFNKPTVPKQFQSNKTLNPFNTINDEYIKLYKSRLNEEKDLFNSNSYIMGINNIPEHLHLKSDKKVMNLSSNLNIKEMIVPIIRNDNINKILNANFDMNKKNQINNEKAKSKKRITTIKLNRPVNIEERDNIDNSINKTILNMQLFNFVEQKTKEDETYRKVDNNSSLNKNELSELDNDIEVEGIPSNKILQYTPNFIDVQSKHYKANLNHIKQKHIGFSFTLLLNLYSKINGSNLLFCILLYLSNKELRILYNTGKRVRSLIQRVVYEISSILITSIRLKTSQFFQLIKSKLIFSRVKDNILIDLKITSRVKCSCEKNIEFCWGVLTRYVSENLSNSIYKNIFQIDIIHNQDENNKTPINLWICREFTGFHSDTLQNCYTQPVLAFQKDDILTFNLNIFSDKGFIDFFSSKVVVNTLPIPDCTSPIDSTFHKKIEFEPRICDLEVFKNRWKDIKSFNNKLLVINKMKNLFGALFEIQKIAYDDVGYIIFKVVLRAAKRGIIERCEELGLVIKIKDRSDHIKNEARKNNLIFERRNKIEMRVNDILIFYLSHSK